MSESQSGLDTFPKLLMQHARVRPERPAIREKDLGIWQTWTWHRFADEVRALACGLHAMGLKRGDKIAIVGDRPEAMVVRSNIGLAASMTTLGQRYPGSLMGVMAFFRQALMDGAHHRGEMAAYEKAGWTIVTRGMPCFIAKKPGEWLRIVWVEPAGGWRTVQKAMQAAFRNLGLNVKIVGYKQEVACQPNEGLPEFCPRCNHPLARK